MSEDLLPSQLLPLLNVTSGPLRGASFRLRPGVCVIGREDGVDIVIDDSKVSRRHATVELMDGRVSLADAGSTNGTWCNGQRLSRAVELCDGDRIRIGGVELRFYDPAEARTEPVSTIRYTPPIAAIGGAPSGPAVKMPTEPQRVLTTGPRPGRLLLVASGILLASWLVWIFFG